MSVINQGEQAHRRVGLLFLGLSILLFAAFCVALGLDEPGLELEACVMFGLCAFLTGIRVALYKVSRRTPPTSSGANRP